MNNKGFAISSIMYIILILAVVLIALTLSILSSRKLILDKLKSEVLTTVNDDSLTLGQTLRTLKREAITYATQNNLEIDSIRISNFETSIDEDTVNKYELGNKYLTMSLNNNTYDIYLGEEKTITNLGHLPENAIDIIDYKIYGNTYQKTSVQGKDLFSINNRTLGTLSSEGTNTSVREFEFDKYYVGLTVNNYYYPSKVLSYSVSGENVVLKTEAAGYGIGIPIKVKSNIAYTLSATTEETIGIGFYTSSGEYINDTYSTTFTTPENCGIITIILRPQANIDATYADIQLEQGTSATGYEAFIPNMPSPNYPSEIESVGEKTNNKFDLANITFNGSSVTSVSKENNKIVFDNSNSNLGEYFYTTNIENFNLKPNTTYTSKVKIIEEVIQSDGISSGSMNKSLILQDNNTYSSNTKFYIVNGYSKVNVDNDGYYYTTFTTPEDMTNLTYITTRLNGYSKLTFQELMIVEGTYGKDNFPNYEPYGYKIPIKVSSDTEEITTNIYLTEPLRRIEELKDEVAYNNKTFSRNINEYIITGNEADIGSPWTFSGGYGSEIRSPILSRIGYPQSLVALSNYYPYFSSGNYTLDHLRLISDLSSYGYIAINDLNYPGKEQVDGFISNLADLYKSGNPVKVYYPLKDPIINDVYLPRIKTINGASTIEIGTNIKPSSVEFTVIEKIKQL